MEIIGNKPECILRTDKIHLHGTTVNAECPECSSMGTTDLGVHPLEFPPVNRPVSLPMFCSVCLNEWDVFLTLRLEVVASTAVEAVQAGE